VDVKSSNPITLSYATVLRPSVVCTECIVAKRPWVKVTIHSL